MNYTDEQLAIINSKGDIKINAVAGAGKTTTLVGYAKERPNAKILYLAFNKTVKEEAQIKFKDLPNVKAETAHSLAYKHIVKMGYRLGEGLSINNIIDILKLPKSKDIYILAFHISKAFSCYCNSDKRNMLQIDYLVGLDNEAKAFFTKHSETILDHTKILLRQMNSKEIPMTHDFYLKKFQTLNPDLRYDIILFDEGQDASEVMLDIFKKQTATKVIVGDSHQQIYSWRYAVNSLEKCDYANYYLNTSFRFDSNIAKLAKAILDVKQSFDDDYKSVEIIGGGKFVGSLGKKQKAFLGRTNFGLIAKALELNKPKIYFEGHINSYLNSDSGVSIYDIMNLHSQDFDRIKNPIIKGLKDIDELYDYIEKTGDKQLKPMADLVNSYGKRLSYLLFELKNSHVEKKNAEYIFSTCHKSKGMEYDRVELLGDFTEINETDDNEEINLIYVAATRTKSSLIINENQVPENLKEIPSNIFIKRNDDDKKKVSKVVERVNVVDEFQEFHDLADNSKKRKR
jgi:superfamily I DNA/RNA helicase